MTAATTRFLLGRRGRHLYPLKSPTTLMGSSSQDGSPLNSHTSKNIAGGSTTTTTLGRHGIPPPSNRNWNCRTKRSNNTTASMTPTYAYGFPPAAPSTTKWAFSPIVAVTLILLSFCFVGAYCLVLRIDSTIQESVSGGTVSSSSNAAVARTMASSSLSTSSATTFSRMMEKETHSTTAAILYMIPLYLNVTVFQIPCDELTVQVVQGDSQNNEQQASAAVTDRLVFKTVMIDEQNQHTNQQSSASSRIARTRARGLSSLHQHHVVTVPVNNNNRTKEAAAAAAEQQQITTIVKQSVTTSTLTSGTTTTTSGNEKQQPSLRIQQQRRLEEQAAEDDDERQSQQQQQQDEEHTIHNSDAHHHSHHPTQGCQIKGHLQLPLGNAQRPAIVSIKSLYPRHHHHPQQHHDISLSHRIDKLKLGSSWKKFPMEETMLMDKKTKFKPTTYNDPHQQQNDNDAVIRVKHHYQVQQNFQIAEQSGSPTPTSNAKQQTASSENTPEIQLVFEPNQQE